MIPVDSMDDIFLTMRNLPDGSSQRMSSGVGGDGDGRGKKADGVGLRVFQLRNLGKVGFNLGRGRRVQEPVSYARVFGQRRNGRGDGRLAGERVVGERRGVNVEELAVRVRIAEVEVLKEEATEGEDGESRIHWYLPELGNMFASMGVGANMRYRRVREKNQRYARSMSIPL